MELFKQGSSKQAKTLKLSVYLVFMSLSLLSYPVASVSPDLLAGTDLQESPLSLSLSTSVDIDVAGQNQQLVISQYGILNKATIKQMANGANSIIVSQNGINNSLNISQYGYENIINLQQQGNDNSASVIQEGDANVANISQLGEQTLIIHQIGNEMVVNISQY